MQCPCGEGCEPGPGRGSGAGQSAAEFHGGGIRRMKEKYEYWIKDMKKRFPQYRKNPYVGILKPKGQTWKIKLGVGLIGDLEKIHCAKPLLYIISLV